MNVIWIAVSAFVGGIVGAALGWLDSAESFEPRKFTASILRALFAAIAFAIAYNFTNGITAIDIGAAFLGGAGIDVLGNRFSGSVKAGILNLIKKTGA